MNIVLRNVAMIVALVWGTLTPPLASVSATPLVSLELGAVASLPFADYMQRGGRGYRGGYRGGHRGGYGYRRGARYYGGRYYGRRYYYGGRYYGAYPRVICRFRYGRRVCYRRW